MKLIKQFSIILIILLMIAGISTVLAVSDDDSLGANKGSFVSEDSYSDGDGHFESDDDSSSPPSDDDVDDDVDDEDNPEDNSFKVNLFENRKTPNSPRLEFGLSERGKTIFAEIDTDEIVHLKKELRPPLVSLVHILFNATLQLRSNLVMQRFNKIISRDQTILQSPRMF